MVPSSPPSQGTLPWLGYALVCIALTILGAYALFYYCPQPFLDPRHPTSEIGSTLRRLFQNQEAVPPPKATDDRVSSLNNEIQKLYMRLDVVTKRKEDIEDIMIEREAEYRGRQFRLEETWSRAREELQESSRQIIARALAEQAKEIASLRTGLEAMRNECKWRDDLIWSLSLEKDGLDATIKQYEWETLELRGTLARMNAERATNENRILTWQEEERGLRGARDQLEQKVVELTDKLSECHSRLAKQDPLHIMSFPWLSSPLLMSPSSEQQTSRPSKSSPKVSGVFRNTRSAPSSSTMSHLTIDASPEGVVVSQAEYSLSVVQ